MNLARQSAARFESPAGSIFEQTFGCCELRSRTPENAQLEIGRPVFG